MRQGTAIISLVYIEHNLVRIVTDWDTVLPDVPIYLFCDGCDEPTREAIRELVMENMVYVPIPVAANRYGYVRAMKRAYNWMLDNTNFENILVVDSDGCYSPQSIKRLYDANRDICGSRPHRKESPSEYWYRIFYMKSEKYVMGILFGLVLQDYSAGCRLMNIERAAETVNRVKYSKWGFWLEFDVLWQRAYGDLEEINVEYTPKPTKTFALSRMPDILWSELKALLHLRWDLWFKR